MPVRMGTPMKFFIPPLMYFMNEKFHVRLSKTYREAKNTFSDIKRFVAELFFYQADRKTLYSRRSYCFCIVTGI